MASVGIQESPQITKQGISKQIYFLPKYHAHRRRGRRHRSQNNFYEWDDTFDDGSDEEIFSP